MMSWPLCGFTQISIMGNTDCGTWINQKRAVDRFWVSGYISGINAVRSTEKNDILKKIQSGEQVYLYIDNYCRDNPLKEVQNALNSLWLELEKK